MLAESRLATFLKNLTNGLSRLYVNPTIGSALQGLSFYVVVILFACLPLPSFANDKEGLALILITGALVWSLGTVFGGKEKTNTNAIDLLVIAYACVNLIATASSHYFTESLRGLAKVYVYIIGYFLFSAQLSNNWRRKLVLVSVLLVSSALVSIYGLYQYKIGVAPLATWEDPSIEEKVTRIYATLNNPNLLAGYLVPIVPLAASLAIAALARRRWILSLLPGSVFALTALATILTGSRGGYLGLFGGLAFLVLLLGSFLWQQHPKMRPWLGALIVLMPLAILISIHSIPTLEHRIMSMFAGREHSSNSFRLNVWLSSMAMFKDNWWIGIGVGNQAFRLVYGLYMRSGFDALGTYCVPLEVAVETGVLGLCVFALLIIACLARGHFGFWKAQSALHRYLTAGAAASLIGLMIHGLVDTVFYRPQVQFIFWLMIALLAKSGDPDDQNAL